MSPALWHVLLYTQLYMYLHAEAVLCRTEYTFRMVCPNQNYGTHLNTYHNFQSAIACSEVCADDLQCRSLQYDPTTGECQTNAEKMITPSRDCSNLIRYGEVELGSCHAHRMFEPCNSNADCVTANSACRNGSCQCKDGHPYDYRFDSCPTGCTKYGNTLHEVPYFISWNNQAYITGISIEQCHERCFTATDFTCRFIEYDKQEVACKLSEVNALTAEPTPNTFPHWIQWDRNCG